MMSLGLTLETPVAARAAAGLVGPNAVIQVGEALRASAGGPELAARVFQRAGLLRLLHQPPDAMIDEGLAARLFEALWQELPPASALRIAHQAGRRTGAYVLANRIPSAAKLVLRALPRGLAARLLLQAIARNAWTFAGSGHCEVKPGSPATITITGNPLAMPRGMWHVGVFEVLFRALVGEHTTVQLCESQPAQAQASVFRIDWNR